MYCCLSGTAPSYFAESICRVADIDCCCHRPSSALATLIIASISQPLATGHLLSLIHRRGTVCHHPFEFMITHHLPIRTEDILIAIWALLNIELTQLIVLSPALRPRLCKVPLEHICNSIMLIITFLIYTTINFIRYSVTEVGTLSAAGWAWLFHSKQTWVANWVQWVGAHWVIDCRSF